MEVNSKTLHHPKSKRKYPNFTACQCKFTTIGRNAQHAENTVFHTLPLKIQTQPDLNINTR